MVDAGCPFLVLLLTIEAGIVAVVPAGGTILALALIVAAAVMRATRAGLTSRLGYREAVTKGVPRWA